MSARDKLIKDLLSYPEVRTKLAASLIEPLRSRRDYQSVGRKTFLVEEIPCSSCKRTNYDEGYAAGCLECTTRSVMES